METPTIKCPRSGRLLTPLSLDYWRLKKIRNLMSSESDASDEESTNNENAPVCDNLSKSTPMRPSRKSSDSDEITPLAIRMNKLQKKTPKKRSPELLFVKGVSSSDSEEDPVVNRRRNNKKILSSDEEWHPVKTTIGEEVETTLSERLKNTVVQSSSSSSSSDKDNLEPIIIQSSSDDEFLQALNERIKKNLHKTPLQKPKKRIPATVIPKAHTEMPPPRKPLKKTIRTPKSQLSTPKLKEFDDELENMRQQKHDGDHYDESKVDLNNSVNDWEQSNEDDKRFLRSLSEDDVLIKDCHPDAVRYRKLKFANIKDELVERLFEVYHRSVFQNRFDKEIPITWNVRMSKTAGFCYYRRHTSGDKSARIELSPKVVDRTSRLRDTLLHELCHAAAWLIHGYRDGHGVLFKFWGQRAKQLLDLTVTTCHTYQIETKYVYKCDGCANEVRRHSKSLDTSRFICSNCKGRFTCFVNGRSQKAISTPKNNPYTNFLKEQFSIMKIESPHLTHQEKMTLVAKKWETMKS